MSTIPDPPTPASSGSTTPPLADGGVTPQAGTSTSSRVAAVPSYATPGAAVRPRRRRWVFWIGGIVVVLLVLLARLVVFAPTFACTAAVRGMVVSKINDELNGRITVESWSVGWTTGLKVTGVFVYDATGAQIAQLPEISTDLTLLNAIRGHYALGNVLIRGLDANIVKEPDGTLNLSKLSKSSASSGTSGTTPSGSAPSSTTAPESKSSTTLPDASAKITLADCRGTYVDETAAKNTTTAVASKANQTVEITALNGTISVPDLRSQPVEQHLVIAEHASTLSPGTLHIDGSILAAKDGKLDVAGMTGQETVALKDQLAVEGVTVSDMQLPVKIDGGIATVQSSDKTATCNGGTLNLSGVAINFGGDVTTINIPAGLKMLSGVRLDPVLAAKLSTFVGPFFANSDQADGIVELTCEKCVDLPLGDLMEASGPTNKGVADFTLNISQLQVVSGMLAQGLGLANLKSVTGSLVSKDHIEGGVDTTNTTVSLGSSGKDLAFDGGIGLKQLDLRNFTMGLGAGFLKQINPGVGAAFAQGLSVPVTGTVSQPQVDLNGAFQKNLLSGNGVAGLLKGAGVKLPAGAGDASGSNLVGAATQPAQAQDLIGNLLGQALDKNKKHKHSDSQ